MPSAPRVVAVGAAWAVAALLVAEWLAFAWVGVLGCEEVLAFEAPATETRPDPGYVERMLIISDVHILGTRRRSWLDRWWTDRQIANSFWAAAFWTRPDTVVALGDHLDEGYIHTTPKQWDAYVARLRGALPREDAILGIVGNHDAHSAAHVSGAMLERFERSFGSANQFSRRTRKSSRADADNLFFDYVVLNGIGLEACTTAKRDLFRLRSICTDVEEVLNEARVDNPAGVEGNTDAARTRMLFLHVPLFRPNDADCGPTRLRESAHVTYVGPHDALRVGEDVLSAATTQTILEHVRPRLVFSGHTHAQCVRQLETGPAGPLSWEVTLPTFSWRMRPDPGFGVLEIERGQAHVRICRLPHEYWTIGLYVLAALSAAAGSIWSTLGMTSSATLQKKE